MISRPLVRAAVGGCGDVACPFLLSGRDPSAGASFSPGGDAVTVLEEIGKALAAGVVASMIVVVFCCGSAWVLSLGRQTVRDIAAWARRQREARAAGHLLRQIRSGRLGI